MDNFISLQNNNLYGVLNKEIKKEITVKIEELDPEDFETDIIQLGDTEELSNFHKIIQVGTHKLYDDHIVKNEMLVIGPEMIQTNSNNILNSAYRDKNEPETHNLTNINVKSYPKMSNRSNATQPQKNCKFCNKHFMKTSNLKRHQDYHCGLNAEKEKNNKEIKYGMFTQPFTCDYCKKSYTHKSTLTTHMRTHARLYGHRSALKYGCSSCNKKYTKKHNLTCHMESTHLNVKSYTCRYCSSQFSWRWSVVSHENTHHKERLLKKVKLAGR